MAKSWPALKIGFVLDGGLEKPDGVQQYILRLGEWLISQGHEVRYLVAGQIAPNIDHAVSLSRNIAVKSNGNKLKIPLPAKSSTLKKYLEAEKFDVLHIQTPYSPMMGERLIMMSSRNTAIVGTFHIVPFNKTLAVGDWLLGRWSQRSIKRFDKMLSVSTAAQAIAKRDFKIESEVLPNVVDYQRFKNAEPFSKYKDGKVNILFLGRLVNRKGCAYLLEAIANISRNKPELDNFRVIICGTGQLEDSLKKFCKDNGLMDIVSFEGFISEEDKPRYYASADICVFPSTGGESFGIVLIEAMASGKSAVLAGNNVGYSSVLDQKPELLFNPTNIDLLAAKLGNLISNESERQKLAKWCNLHAKEYDVKTVGLRLVNIYHESLINKGKR